MSARSHGISCTSFLVYSPDLPIQVTIALSDFTVFRQLVFLYPPYIRFLFVEPRFRYVFLSPPLTEVSFDSRYRVHRQQVPQGNCTPDVQHARRTKKKKTEVFFFRRSKTTCGCGGSLKLRVVEKRPLFLSLVAGH